MAGEPQGLLRGHAPPLRGAGPLREGRGRPRFEAGGGKLSPVFPETHPLFSLLAPAERAALEARARSRDYVEDETIFLEGEPAARLWFLASGQVKMVRPGGRGFEAILEVIMPGELFGGAVILQEDNPSTAVAMAPSRVVALPREDWEATLRRNAPLSTRLLGLVGQRLRLAMAACAAATERVDRRVSAILLRLAEKTGTPAEGGGLRLGIVLTRQDLAEMAGTTVETTIRVMSRFRKEGIADSDPEGRIVIRDPGALGESGRP